MAERRHFALSCYTVTTPYPHRISLIYPNPIYLTHDIKSITRAAMRLHPPYQESAAISIRRVASGCIASTIETMSSCFFYVIQHGLQLVLIDLRGRMPPLLDCESE